MKTAGAFLAALVVAAALPSQGVFIPPMVPPGFTIDILTEAVERPVGLAFLPDGRILIAEQLSAAIKVWTGGASAPTVGIVPGVNSGGFEAGLLAIAVDPQWPTRPYLYAWFNSSASSHMRLAMFTVTGDLTNPVSSNLSLGAQYDILTDVPDNASIHNGGSLHFGPDGMLYLSSGDDANPCAAQNVDSLLGCILRLDVSALPGTGPGPPAKSVLVAPGNPFPGPSQRNPFRFHIDPVTGRIHVADVGSWLAEEINEATVGGENFGWPWLEGNLFGLSCTGTAPSSVHPVATLPHFSPVSAIMSLGRYRNVPGGSGNFGMAYEGDYFFLEFYSGAVRRLKFAGTAWIPAPPVAGQPTLSDWATGFQSVVDSAVGPDGALYFVKQFHSHYWGALGRIRGTPNATVLGTVSGNNQPGNAGRALAHPFVVSLTTQTGTPVPGAAVNFIVAAGGGSVNPAVATTDAQGLASTTYTLPAAYTQAPAIVATSSGSSYAVFTPVWRGISVADAGPVLGYFTTELRHSQTNSPFTIVWEPPAATPYASTSWGDIWTSVASPVPGLGSMDGLGLFGPPDPQFRTQADIPYFLLTISGLPPTGGTTLLVQAYGIDTSLFPAPEAIMISNTQIVTIP
jgi:glucose/arabinose dehydrogenase